MNIRGTKRLATGIFIYIKYYWGKTLNQCSKIIFWNKKGFYNLICYFFLNGENTTSFFWKKYNKGILKTVVVLQTKGLIFYLGLLNFKDLLI
jgi:hypothetical protein